MAGRSSTDEDDAPTTGPLFDAEGNLMLWAADPDCDHDVQDALGGGVKCTLCTGWLCL